MKIRQHLFAALVAVAAVTPALAGPPVAQTIEITAPRITSAAEIDGMFAMETGKRLEVQNYGDALRVRYGRMPAKTLRPDGNGNFVSADGVLSLRVENAASSDARSVRLSMPAAWM